MYSCVSRPYVPSLPVSFLMTLEKTIAPKYVHKTAIAICIEQAERDVNNTGYEFRSRTKWEDGDFAEAAIEQWVADLEKGADL